jgi:hypothetical protein
MEVPMGWGSSQDPMSTNVIAGHTGVLPVSFQLHREVQIGRLWFRLAWHKADPISKITMERVLAAWLKWYSTCPASMRP